jgi:hypothetical protein
MYGLQSIGATNVVRHAVEMPTDPTNVLFGKSKNCASPMSANKKIGKNRRAIVWTKMMAKGTQVEDNINKYLEG